MKKEDFQVLVKFTQTPLKLFNYQSYQYNYRVSQWLSVYSIALGNDLSILNEIEYRNSRPNHWCLSLNLTPSLI